MTTLETLLAFITVFSLTFGLPLAAIVTRKNSLIGQALAERIRQRRRRRIADDSVGSGGAANPDRRTIEFQQQEELLSAQQNEIRELQDRIDFLERLIEARDTKST